MSPDIRLTDDHAGGIFIAEGGDVLEHHGGASSAADEGVLRALEKRGPGSWVMETTIHAILKQSQALAAELEFYQYILQESLIDKTIRDLNEEFKRPVSVIAISRADYELQVRQAPWTLWQKVTDSDMAHPYNAGLEIYLADRGIHFEVRTLPPAIGSSRHHRLQAINRWFYQTWVPLDRKLKASVVEGIVVFLSLFDETPRSAARFVPRVRRTPIPRNPGIRGPCRPSTICSSQGTCLA